MLSFELTEDGWFDGLPPGQAPVLRTMLESGKTEEQVAEFWLSATGPDTTAGFGATGRIQKFFSNVKQEFNAFVCDDDRYEEERQQAARIWNEQGKVALVSMVAAVVASNIGLAVAAVVPVVALLFSLSAKVGINAYCESCLEDNDEKETN